MSSVDLWIAEKCSSKLVINTKHVYTEILSKYLDYKDLTITYNQYGKPLLPSKNNLYFSVSHTANIIVVAVTRHGELGVDIEKATRNIYDPMLIAEKFFHSHEIKVLKESSNLENAFMQLWVIKEAFVKMMGLGIGYGLDQFYVNIKDESIFSIEGYRQCEYNLFNIANNYICSITPRFDNINFCAFRQLSKIITQQAPGKHLGSAI